MEDRRRELSERAGTPLEMSSTASATSSSSSSAPGLQGEVMEITKRLDQLRDNTQTIQKATQARKMESSSAVLAENTNALIFEVKGKIIALSRGMTDSSNPESPIRQTQHAKLSGRFKELVEEYKKAQDNHKQTWIDVCTEQAKVVSPGITRDEVAELVEKGKENSLIAEKLLGASHVRAKEEYKFITGWYEDLQRLEKSITELLELFIDVSNLVEVQGEALEKTTVAIDDAVADGKEAIKYLNEANAAGKKKRNRRAIACCCVGTAATAAAGGAGAAAYLGACTIS